MNLWAVIPTVALLLGSSALLGLAYREMLFARRQLRILNAQRMAASSAIQKSRMDLLEVRNRARLLEDTVSGGASAVA